MMKKVVFAALLVGFTGVSLAARAQDKATTMS
jgi:hypothetical protein